MQILEISLIVTVVVLFGVAAVLDWAILRRLRRDHSEVWRSLGEPTVVFNHSIKNSFAVRRFFRTGQHRTLNDPVLMRLCQYDRFVSWAYPAILVALVVVRLKFGSD